MELLFTGTKSGFRMATLEQWLRGYLKLLKAKIWQLKLGSKTVFMTFQVYDNFQPAIGWSDIPLAKSSSLEPNPGLGKLPNS